MITRLFKTSWIGWKAILAILVIMAAAALFFGGCAVKTAPQQLKMVTIAFQEFVGYGPFYLAQNKGFFKDEGIDVIFVDEQLDFARSEAFRLGMLDCDATTLDVLISKRAHDVPVVTVMELDRSNGVDGIVAIPGIRTLEDLIGKKVALARDDTGETFLSVLFHERNLPFDTITIVPKGPEEVAKAFIDGEADAAVTWEPQLSAALTRPDSHLLITTKDTPGIIIDTLNIREDIVINNPGLVKGLMRGWFRALDYYKAHPEEASAIIARYYRITPAQYRQDVQGLIWTDYKTQMSTAEESRLIHTFNTITDLKFASKQIPRKPDVKESIRRALLQGLYEDSK